jgi:Protein of unknown function (DUF1194)
MRFCPMRFPAFISFLMLLTGPAAAAEKTLATDANLVTALDVSDSIMRHDEWLQFQGLAKALTHPSFLHAVTSGRHRRVGFAVFAWSSDGAFAVIVPWKVVGSRSDAVQVAAMLESWPRVSRWGWPRTDTRPNAGLPEPDRRTDLSAAIDYAAALAHECPFEGYMVVNVAANGIDNVGAGPSMARDRAVAAGLVVNGLVIDGKKGVADHFRANVQGGPGSFVIDVFEPADMVRAMLNKLLRDLISAAANQSWT